MPKLLLLAFAALLAGLALARALPRWRRRRRQRVAVEGEHAAERVLARAGYRVLARQVRRAITVEIDERAERFELRADLLLARGGRRYVAEVKTGNKAPALRTSATRRQLLEYRVAYDVDGVLLVDMAAGRVHRVAFPLRRPLRWPWLLFGLLGGAALARYGEALLALLRSACKLG